VIFARFLMPHICFPTLPPPGFPIPAICYPAQSCRPVVLSSWHPGILFAALTHLRGTYSVEGVCEQTTRDVVLTAYCDKYVKRIYENTRCQQPGRKRAIRNNGNAFELFSTAALKRLMPT